MVDDGGRVAYRYKRPFRDGSTHVVLEPLDFMRVWLRWFPDHA